jgi:hypothetical protein
MAGGLTLGIASAAFSQAQMGFSVSNGNLQSFYFAVGGYYHVPGRQVVVVHDYGIPDEELPVVFFIAHHSHYGPDEIVHMRRLGSSWYDVAVRCGVDPYAYDIRQYHQGPPYGNAWGYWKHHPERRIVSDDVFIRRVNERFLSDRYGRSVDDVQRYHSNGYGYSRIADEFEHGHGHGHGEGNDQGEGKSHGHGKHKGW